MIVLTDYLTYDASGFVYQITVDDPSDLRSYLDVSLRKGALDAECHRCIDRAIDACLVQDIDEMYEALWPLYVRVEEVAY